MHDNPGTLALPPLKLSVAEHTAMPASPTGRPALHLTIVLAMGTTTRWRCFGLRLSHMDLKGHGVNAARGLDETHHAPNTSSHLG